MDLETIYALMRRFEDSSLSRLSLRTEAFSLSLGKEGAPALAVSPSAARQTAVGCADAAAPADVAVEPCEKQIKAPLVGTFYKASSPEAAPYASVGQTVKQGDTVCLIEAMKMMNEIPAPCDGVIEAVLVEDGALVEFDQPLFSIRSR